MRLAFAMGIIPPEAALLLVPYGITTAKRLVDYTGTPRAAEMILFSQGADETRWIKFSDVN